MKFIKEFKDFIAKGNVMDLAVAVIIGAAFGKIVTSLVNDIIMPIISLLTGGISVTDWKYVITAEDTDKAIAESAIKYGSFIQNIIDFLIISFCIFIILKILLGAKVKFVKKKIEEPKAPEAVKPTAEDLLTEIRDLLKDGGSANTDK